MKLRRSAFLPRTFARIFRQRWQHRVVFAASAGGAATTLRTGNE